MRKKLFTPGPWVLKPEECSKGYIRLRGSALGGRFKVANIITPTYEGVHERELTETRANAHLIAAAPELLEALEEASESLRSGGVVILADKYDAVLAKAYGDKP